MAAHTKYCLSHKFSFQYYSLFIITSLGTGIHLGALPLVTVHTLLTSLYTFLMRSFLSVVAVFAAACVYGVAAVASTDEYRDADMQQSGYLPNHNMDPAIVDSPQFGLLWTVPFNTNELVR